MSKFKNIISVLLLFCILGACITGVYLYRQKRAMEIEIQMRKQLEQIEEYDESMDLNEDTELTSVCLDGSEVSWNSKTYRRNTYVKAILCIGVDRKNKLTDAKELGEAGQADSIFLIAQDTARNSLKVLMIPRDTMTEISVLNSDGSYGGKQVDHLLMAYAYGDGKETSCQNLKESVSNLFRGLSIDHYLATETTMIGALNDAVDGVTVTVPTPGMEVVNPEFVYGETVTLNGEQAENFVRYRDIETDHSAIFRMNQQKEYVVNFMDSLQRKSMEDGQIVDKLFDMIEDHMITDMAKEQYLKIALDAVENGGLSEEDFFMVPGTDITTEEYDEYHVDEKKMIQVLLDLFYREV